MTARILHVEQPLDAGVPRVVAQLALEQQRRGLHVGVVAPPDGQAWEELSGSGVTLIPWSAGRSPGPRTIGETRALVRAIRGETPDLVHLHSAKAGLAGRLALRGSIPTVFQPHAWSFEAVSGPLAMLSMRWERLAARWTDLTICVSRVEAAAGKAAGITGEITVVPNGVDLDLWAAPTDESRRSAKERAGIGTDERVVVCVGRLSEQKGQDVLLRAWPGVSGAVPGARLYLVGDGPARAALEQAAGARVSFTGQRDDVRDWLLAADVVVIPSRWEGMSLLMLEAMACGRPIVATDVAGASEALGSDAGMLVPPADPVALSDAILALLGDESSSEELGRRARQKVERDHDQRLASARVAELYEEVLQGKV